MNGFAIIFFLINATALMMVPRRWAPLPLLAGTCYMTMGPMIMLGPFHFTVLRLLLAAGFIRVLARGEEVPGGLNGLDWILLTLGAWLLCSSGFHKPAMDVLVTRLGDVYNALGIYFLIRIFCRTRVELIQIIKVTAFLLVPVALEMINEKLTGHNLFAVLGGVPGEVEVRDGKLRAQGPFRHSILAGTVGAVCVPLIAGIWREHPRRAAKVGFAACLAMILASTSSGPLMTLFSGVFALVVWRWRHHTRQMRIAAVVCYLLLNLAMSRPAYFLLQRIDLTGSSTGWHRAELIRQAVAHLNEWWFAGTDYTRHWMPYGVPWSENQIDITNQFLSYGVAGGLPAMILYICALCVAFRYVAQYLRLRGKAPVEEQFLAWCLGAGLFAHAVTGIAVAYFDQSVMFLYLNLAVIGSLDSIGSATTREEVSFAYGSGNSTGDKKLRRGTGLLPKDESSAGCSAEALVLGIGH